METRTYTLRESAINRIGYVCDIAIAASDASGMHGEANRLRDSLAVFYWRIHDEGKTCQTHEADKAALDRIVSLMVRHMTMQRSDEQRAIVRESLLVLANMVNECVTGMLRAVQATRSS